MSRRIVTTQLQATGGNVKVDTYFDKVIKYVPADIACAWIAATGIINGFSDGTKAPIDTILWVVFGIGVVLTAIWIWIHTTEPDKPIAKTQIVISTGAFMVFVFALGGPFETFSWYDPGYGSLSLIFYALIVGLINPRES